MDVAAVGLGGPVAKDFDGVVGNSLSGGSSGSAYTEGVDRIKFKRNP